MQVKFDMRKAEQAFAQATGYMARLTGLDPKKVVRAEAGVILKTCAARTKVAPVSALTMSGRLGSLRSLNATQGVQIADNKVTINAGKKAPYGRVWARGPSGKWNLILGDGFSPIRKHLKTPLWEGVTAFAREAKRKVAAGVQKAKDSAGLARGSWVRVADAIGIRLESVQGGQSIAASAIEKARNAKAKSGKQVNNGAAREEEKAKSYFVTLINRLPYGRAIGLDRMLVSVMAGRVKFFNQAVQKGFTGSLKDVQRLFPGWVVK